MPAEPGHPPVESLVHSLISRAQEMGWHLSPAKCGKLGSQSLLVHSVNAATIGMRLAEVVSGAGVNLSERDLRVLFGALAVHDFAKAFGWRCGEEAPRNALTDEERDLALGLLSSLGLSPDEARDALDLSLQCENPTSGEDRSAILRSRSFGKDLVDLCSLADALASVKSLRDGLGLTQASLRRAERLGLRLTYHRVSLVRGLTTQLLHAALTEYHARRGFRPVAYFPDGVVYAAPGSATPPDEVDADEIADLLSRLLFSFLDSAGKALAEAALGRPTATAVKAPEFTLVGPKVLDHFWELVQRESSRLGGGRAEKHGPQLAKLLQGTGMNPDLAAGLAKLTGSLHWMFIHLRFVLDALSDRERNQVLVELSKALGAPPDLIKEAAALANTTATEKAVDILFRLLEQAQVVRTIGEIPDLSSEELSARVLQSVREAIVSALLPLAGKASILGEFRRQARALLSDIVHPPVSGFDPVSEARRRFDLYRRGKRRHNAVCVICGAEATVRGISSLHGEGVESFNNFLPGGSDIGGDRKVFLCSACDLESKLRSVLLRGAETVILLIPQLQASWAVSEVWWNAAADYLSTLSGLAPPYDVGRLSEVLLEDGPGAWDAVYRRLARVVAAGGRSRPVRLLAEILKSHYSDLSALSYRFRQNFRTYEEAARWILENGALGELPEDVRDAVREGGASRWAVGYASSNYLVVLTGRIGGDEPETARLIRAGFFALLLARALFATAVIPSIPLQVLGPELVPKGYGELPGKLLLREILWDTLGLETGWVPLERVDEILVRLAALLRADSIMRRYEFAGVPYGRDNLIQLARREPGQVLARAAGKMRGDHLRELARCLRIWWEGPASPPGAGSSSVGGNLALAGASAAGREV